MSILKKRLEDDVIAARIKTITDAGIPFVQDENAYIGKGVYIPVFDIDTIDDSAFQEIISHIDENDHSMDRPESAAGAVDLETQAKELAVLQQELTRKAKALKIAQAEIDETWAKVEEAMVANDVKSIKGEWGSLTIVERPGWDVDEESLPAEFFKRVPDTKKISSTYDLEGEAPAGAVRKVTKYLMKRIKT